MITKQFFKSSVIYSAIGALPYASGFLLIPWFTSFLTPSQFGVNALYISLMYFIQILSVFGMDMSVGVNYFDYRDDKEKLRKYIGTVLGILGIAGLTTFLFFVFGGIRLFNLVFSKQQVFDLLPFGLMTIVSGILMGVFKSYSNLLINQQKPERFFWLNISNFLITIGVSLLLIYLFPFTLYGPIVGRLVPAFVSAAISIILMKKEFGFGWSSDIARSLYKYCRPLILYALLTWTVTYIDRFIILRLLNDTTLVGIYDFTIKLVLFIDLILGGLANATTPKVFSLWQKNKSLTGTIEINRYYNGLTALVLFIIPMFIILTPYVIPIIVKKEIYYQGFQYIGILSIGYAFKIWYFMFLNPLMFYKQTKLLPRVMIISASVQIVSDILLIHFFGLIGAVLTNFIIKPVQGILLWYASRKVYNYNFNKLKIIFLPVIITTWILITELFISQRNMFVIHVLQCLMTFLVLFFIFRKEIKPLFHSLIKSFYSDLK